MRRSSALLLVGLLVGCGLPLGRAGYELPPPPPGTSPAGALGGRVRDAGGRPVAGAFVSIVPSSVEAVTDAAGAWRVPRVRPGTYTIEARAPGLLPGRAGPVEVGDGEGVGLDVALAPATASPLDGTVRLTVSAPDGGPAADATVATSAGLELGRTDADGLATLTGVGGLADTLVVDWPEHRVVPARVAVEVPALGGVERTVSLAGRGEPDDVTTTSAVCVQCHAETGDQWRATAHAQAAGRLAGAPEEAFDAGLAVSLGDAVAELGRDVDGTPLVTLEDATGARDVWEVVGVLGGPRRGAVPWAERDGLGWALPVAWVAPDDRYPGFLDGGWIAGDTAPWLLADGSFAYEVTPDPAASAEAACLPCHVTGTVVGVEGGRVELHGLASPSVRFDEPGVGCEACHGIGQTHAAGPLSSKLGSLVVPDDLGVDRANDVCGRCHAAIAGDEGVAYPWTVDHGLFRPGDDLGERGVSVFDAWPSGAAAIPGAALDELRASVHGTGGWNAACIDCHDPHGSPERADLRLSADDDDLCLSCHLPGTFGGDPEAAADHGGHLAEEPGGPEQSGRCVGCHMPETAARLGFRDATGAGDLSSHAFVAVPPSDSVDAFDAVGAATLPAGAFPPNACQACHEWNAFLQGASFPGVAGAPLTRATHAAHQAAYEGLFP